MKLLRHFQLHVLVCLIILQTAAGTTIDRFTVETNPSDRVLGIPRQQVIALSPKRIVVFVAGWTGRNLLLSNDLDALPRWVDDLDLTNSPSLSSADSHAHLSSDHDTIYVALPMVGGDSLLVKFIAVQNGRLQQIGYSFTGAYRPTGSWSDFPVYRGGAWFIPGTDSLVLITRGHDGEGNDLMDVMSFISADRGRTWSDSIRVTDLTNAQDQTRVGGFNFFDRTVTALIYSAETNSVQWHNWNRSMQKWEKEQEDPLSGSFDRGYTGNVHSDTVQFVACFNRGIAARDTLRYALKSLSELTWTRGSFEAGTYSGTRWLHSDLCYIEATNRLVLFYQQYVNGSSDANIALHCRWWDVAREEFVDPIRVSSGERALDVAPCLRVPASHGDVAYVSYIKIEGGNEIVELARVDFEGLAVDVGDEKEQEVPRNPSLSPNYPNPFNPSTTFDYALPVQSRVQLTIYNELGQAVRTLADRVQPAGRYTVTWDGRDDRGVAVASGVYFYRLTTDQAVQARKMILVK